MLAQKFGSNCQENTSLGNHGHSMSAVVKKTLALETADIQCPPLSRNTSLRNRGHSMSAIVKKNYLKVARLDFLGAILPKFEH